MNASVSHKIAEDQLHRAWHALEGAGAVRGEDGRLYRVASSGRHSPHIGPDFRSATLECMDGRWLRGDVEIHVSEDEWYSHGHHLDSAYNGVAAHLFLHPGRRRAATTSGIKPFRIHFETIPAGGLPAPPRTPASRAAAAERIGSKQAGFSMEIRQSGADQAIYAGIAECLGFSPNRSGFLHLAQRPAWEALSASMDRGADPLPLLLWAAGFAPRPAGAEINLSGTPPAWRRCHGRPANSPQRRVRGLAALARAFHAAGGPAQYCRQAAQEERGARLAARFAAHAPDGRGAYIGTARARQIVANAVLPALYALGLAAGEPALMRLAQARSPQFPLHSVEILSRPAPDAAPWRPVQIRLPMDSADAPAGASERTARRG